MVLLIRRLVPVGELVSVGDWVPVGECVPVGDLMLVGMLLAVRWPAGEIHSGKGRGAGMGTACSRAACVR